MRLDCPNDEKNRTLQLLRQPGEAWSQQVTVGHLVMEDAWPGGDRVSLYMTCGPSQWVWLHGSPDAVRQLAAEAGGDEVARLALCFERSAEETLGDVRRAASRVDGLLGSVGAEARRRASGVLAA